jgi:hypothetical protein
MEKCPKFWKHRVLLAFQEASVGGRKLEELGKLLLHPVAGLTALLPVNTSLPSQPWQTMFRLSPAPSDLTFSCSVSHPGFQAMGNKQGRLNEG